MREPEGSVFEGSRSWSLQTRLTELLEVDQMNGSDGPVPQGPPRPRMSRQTPPQLTVQGQARAPDTRAEARRPMRDGITEDEYRTVIEVLQWIVANLRPKSSDQEAR